MFGEPEDAVDKDKEQHMRRAAHIYMKRNKIRQETTPYRFDIVSIVADHASKSVNNLNLFKGSE